MEDFIQINISRDEALVLFELLARINSLRTVIGFEHQAEQQVFWNLETTLESLLPEPFDPNYVTMLQAARDRLRPEKDSDA